MTRRKAIKLRLLIEAAMNCTIEDEEALECAELFPEWSSAAVYEAGVRVRYQGVLYKCLQNHTAQENWSPDAAVSLWTRLQGGEGIAAWVQPDSTNAYELGAQVTHNGKIWKSVTDSNVWEPGVYGWEELE